jgi:hypothetical protein
MLRKLSAERLQWVEFGWSQLVSSLKIKFNWWDDSVDVRLSKTCHYIYGAFILHKETTNNGSKRNNKFE